MVHNIRYCEEIRTHECSHPEGVEGWTVRSIIVATSMFYADAICSYLIRAEMIALHEGDVSYTVNPRRGAQFYPDCVQIEVTGDGDVELPEGVSFPGAYSHEDPGVVHNVRSVLHIHPLLPSIPIPIPLCSNDCRY